MNRWLSSIWEANWRSFQYFNLYRLVAAALLIGSVVFSPAGKGFFQIASPLLFDWVGVLYLAVVAAGLGLSWRWHQRFDWQLSIQVVVDVAAVSLAMYAAGGVSSGLGILLLVSLAAASLVGRGRLVLLYAALATLGVLLMQIFGLFAGGFEGGSLVQAGFLSAGFFATAILARLLGQRLMANEDLARRRGIALENQSRISQRVIERMQDGILVVGRDGRILRSNPVAVAMLGSRPTDGAWLTDRSPRLALGFAAWLGGGGPEQVDFSGVDGDDLRARFESTASTEGEALVFIEDIGRIKERAQQLKLASLGRLTASIAHEIRNPLSAIGHAGDLLREERRGEMQDRLLKILNDNVARLDRIVQDILELGRSDRAQPERLGLDAIVGEFVAGYARDEGLSPGLVVVDGEAGLALCFDRSHLHQVLWNLVGNAVRHSRRQGGSVQLRMCPGGDPGRVELHVIDDGAGVPEDLRGQIFEPFFTTRAAGTGLGLFIARELCEANGASLELEPDAGCGHFILAGRSDTCQ